MHDLNCNVTVVHLYYVMIPSIKERGEKAQL